MACSGTDLAFISIRNENNTEKQEYDNNPHYIQRYLI
jgi:hypothetical protein